MNINVAAFTVSEKPSDMCILCFTDSRTLKLGGLLRKDQDDDFIYGIRRILENLNFYDTVINITATHK